MAIHLMSTEPSNWLMSSRVVAAIYYGTVHIGDLPALPATISTAGDEPLLGRGITHHQRLIFDHGRTVTAEL